MRALLTQSSFSIIQSSLKDKVPRNVSGMSVITAADDCLNILILIFFIRIINIATFSYAYCCLFFLNISFFFFKKWNWNTKYNKCVFITSAICVDAPVVGVVITYFGMYLGSCYEAFELPFLIRTLKMNYFCDIFFGFLLVAAYVKRHGLVRLM